MHVVPDLSWQWRPDAAVTASAATQRCSALALQYPDYAVVRVRPSEFPFKSQGPETDDARGLELHGHADRVSTLAFHAFHDSLDVLLASASSDSVLVWHVDAECHATKSVVVEKPVAEPAFVAFDHTGTLLAVACDKEIEVRVIHSSETLVTLEGHLARVTKCAFHPIRQHLLFSCSEDRTFKIWDLAAKTLLFQSAVLSAFPILSLALNPVTGDACFGFGDGTIKIFSLHESFAREHATLNVETFMRRLKDKTQRQEELQDVLRESPNVVSSLPPWARSDRAQETAQIQAIVSNATRMSYGDFGERRRSAVLSPDPDTVAEMACPVLAMQFLCVDAVPSFSSSDRPAFNAHDEQELLDREQFLVLAVPSHLVAMNAFSYEFRILHDFQSPVFRADATSALDPVAVAQDVTFYTPDGSDLIYCAVVSAFLPCFTVLSCSITRDKSANTNKNNQTSEEDARTDRSDGERISVIATGPPPKDSVLNLPPLTRPSSTTKQHKTLDKPITFRTRIKSSGYGTPQGPPKRATIAERKTGTLARPPASIDAFLEKEYPTTCGLLQHFQPKNALPPKTLHHGAILRIEFSSDAKWLASSGTDKLAVVSKLPFSKHQGDGNVLAGHDHSVRSVHWSQSNELVLTTGSDKTARVWVADSDVASLTLDGGTPLPSQNSISSAKKAMPLDVVDAQFFYMDKFILSASGNAVRLHQFDIDKLHARALTRKAMKNDLLHSENTSRKKKAATWRWPEMQSVTSVTGMNGSFLSSIILAAGSDRSLRILDAAVGKTVRVLHEAHARAAHTVVLPRASCFVSHPPNFYDLVLSSAPNSTIHLWDIRADNCVMRFGEHVNRVHALGVAFSPCMRYVATGSEDRCAYLYDIRTGRCLTRLTGHTDVVTAVAFNPLHRQLATASYDGTVRFYSDTTT